MGINSIAEKQQEDSQTIDEVHSRLFGNGLVTDFEKTKIKIENIENWKKNISKVLITIVTALIITGLSIVFIK